MEEILKYWPIIFAFGTIILSQIVQTTILKTNIKALKELVNGINNRLDKQNGKIDKVESDQYKHVIEFHSKRERK